MQIIQKALSTGRYVLSEYESKQLLAGFGIPVTREILVENAEDLISATRNIGYPLVLKGCSSEISHKTETDIIRLDIRTESEAVAAFHEIKAKLNGIPGGILVQEMIKGQRELMAGLTRDPQFGPCVMFGLGGIFTEILKDVSFRLAPLKPRDADDMMREIKGHKILEAIRGMEAADTDMLVKILMKLGDIGIENEPIKEIDINPLILRGGKPVAVDALVVLSQSESPGN
ncbi:MAG: acetate--CoA ligase family protein [Desulfomonilaceae bacterium]